MRARWSLIRRILASLNDNISQLIGFAIKITINWLWHSLWHYWVSQFINLGFTFCVLIQNSQSNFSILKFLAPWTRCYELIQNGSINDFESVGNRLLTSPPAAHAVTIARSLSSWMRRLAAAVTNRTPVAPKGWPSDKLPPHKFNLSNGISPNLK